MSKLFIFQHGWGFDKNFWQHIAPYFQDEQCIFLDQGYFGRSSSLDTLPSNYRYIGIGHSLGFIKLINRDIRFDCLIGLNSFTNFLSNEPQLQSLRKKEIILMKQNIKQNYTKTLDNFYQRCGLKLVNADYNKIINDLLIQDLDALLFNYSILVKTPILIINSKDDVIVPEFVSLDNFNRYARKQTNIYLEMLESGGHGLGYLQAELIHSKIINFINATV